MVSRNIGYQKSRHIRSIEIPEVVNQLDKKYGWEGVEIIGLFRNKMLSLEEAAKELNVDSKKLEDELRKYELLK